MPTRRDAATRCVDPQAELYSCASVSEGRSACIALTLSADGVVLRVGSDGQAPLTDGELACIRRRLLGKCVNRATTARRVCAHGV